MTPRATELLAEVLALPEGERAEFTERVLESLDPPTDELSPIDRMTDGEFAAELERRHEEAERDPSVLVPWDEVKRRALEG